jgi:hypothetical protein
VYIHHRVVDVSDSAGHVVAVTSFAARAATSAPQSDAGSFGLRHSTASPDLQFAIMSYSRTRAMFGVPAVNLSSRDPPTITVNEPAREFARRVAHRRPAVKSPAVEASRRKLQQLHRGRHNGGD